MQVLWNSTHVYQSLHNKTVNTSFQEIRKKREKILYNCFISFVKRSSPPPKEALRYCTYPSRTSPSPTEARTRSRLPKHEMLETGNLFFNFLRFLGAFDHCTSHPNNLFPKRRKESSLPPPTAAREGTTTSLPTTNSRLEKNSIHIHICDRSNRRPSLQVRQRRTQWYCLSNSTPTIRGANISWSGLKRWIPRA